MIQEGFNARENSLIVKYPRTYHFPFSLGKGSDDKVLHNWEECLKDKPLLFSEKLDGGNTQINKDGVFARSVVGPTSHPSFDHLKAKWATIKYDLGELSIFGENMYAVHSIEYTKLDSYFYVFAVKDGDQWYSWKDVQEIAEWIGYPTVPVLKRDVHKTVEQNIRDFMAEDSVLGGAKEGIVVRNYCCFENEEFSQNVVKYVRANHIQTDEHWTRNWKVAKLV